METINNTKDYNYYNVDKSPLSDAYKTGGFSYIIKKTFAYISDIFICIIPSLKHKYTFDFDGNKLQYFYHNYNKTWRNERALEIALFKYYLDNEQSNNTLEIGNVMNHYSKSNHIVLDKYESYPGIINKDLLEFTAKDKFDFIFSISTFEHIGIDDFPKDGSKAIRAIKYTIDNLLTDTGQFILSIPTNFNAALNGLINNGDIKNYELICFKKEDESKNLWKQCIYDDMKNMPYNQPVQGIIILKLNKNTLIK